MKLGWSWRWSCQTKLNQIQLRKSCQTNANKIQLNQIHLGCDPIESKSCLVCKPPTPIIEWSLIDHILSLIEQMLNIITTWHWGDTCKIDICVTNLLQLGEVLAPKSHELSVSGLLTTKWNAPISVVCLPRQNFLLFYGEISVFAIHPV